MLSRAYDDNSYRSYSPPNNVMRSDMLMPNYTGHYSPPNCVSQLKFNTRFNNSADRAHNTNNDIYAENMINPNYYPSVNKFTPSNDNFQATLYFGGFSEHNSLVGGCAWSLLDRNNKRIAHGSYFVKQNFPSQMRLEYEGLLNGLQAALMKNLLHIKIRGNCNLAVLQYAKNYRSPHLFSMYHSLDDLDSAISHALPQFRYYEMELITEEMNKFVIRLSKGAIQTHFQKEEVKLQKKMYVPSTSTTMSLRSSPPLPSANTTNTTTDMYPSLTNANDLFPPKYDVDSRPPFSNFTMSPLSTTFSNWSTLLHEDLSPSKSTLTRSTGIFY